MPGGWDGQQLAEEFHANGANLSWSEFLGTKLQYDQYVADPALYWNDLATILNYVDGDVASATYRHARGGFYAQNVVGNSLTSRFAGDGAVMATANEEMGGLPIVVGLAGVATVGVATGTSAGYKFVSTPSGAVVSIPANWAQVQIKGQGVGYQGPGALHKDGNLIRIMDPTSMYPQGYVVYHNAYGQPLDINGKPASKATWHIPLDYKGLLPKWPK